MVTRLASNAIDNPDPLTNPVRSLEDLFRWFDRFLTAMPWMGLYPETPAGAQAARLQNTGAQPVGTAREPRALPEARPQNLLHRIDQSTGYAYYLFGDLQFEPQIAQWLKLYNRTWAEHLNSSQSWNDEHYQLVKADPAFELNGDKYESPDNWHCWNDFFARRLSSATPPPQVAEGLTFPWQKINNNTLDIKTARIENITDLLGDSPYKKQFENGLFTHITLDIHNYHRFHSPVSGSIIDIQDIDGQLTAGGKIIWDKQQHKYRYEQLDNIGFQMIEKRVAIVIEKKDTRLLAIIPIGVAQVGSIQLADGIAVGNAVRQGQELGRFLFGGSDVIVLTN